MTVFSPVVSFPVAAAVWQDWSARFPMHEKTAAFSRAAPAFLPLLLPPVLPVAYLAGLQSVFPAPAAFFSFPALSSATPALVR